MALFSKPPIKKPGPQAPAAKPRPAMSGPPGRPPSAREVAAHHAGGPAARSVDRCPIEPAGDITVTGASLIEWASPGQPSFEVAQANPGLCSILEDAALRYASGHAQQARALLEQGVLNDHDAKLSPLAWLALFDLQQRAGDRAAFDQFALRYVVQFERSAPAWEAQEKPQLGPRMSAGGYVGLAGKLTAATATQLEGLKRAMAKQLREYRLDLMSVTGFDDEGARLLAQALGDARRARFPLLLQRTEKLKPLLDAAVKKGREGGEGAWLLSLELLQWANAHAAFEDRAVEYAVTFELSPPSWEPPVLPEAVAEAAPDVDEAEPSPDAEMLAWSGVMAGSSVPQLSRLTEFAQGRAVVPVDMSQVDRVDFVCAGALLNSINRIETQRRAVQIVGATPIVRALLLLIGISPRHFVKKAQ
jgi:ABC-type transporter Mla MlaB component